MLALQIVRDDRDLLRTPALPPTKERAVPDFKVLASKGSPGHIAITGEIDILTAPQVHAALTGLSGDIHVDCTDVGFIDSAGFHTFDRGYEAAMQRGATFVVSGLSRFPTRIAKLLAVPYLIQSVVDRGPSLRSEPSHRNHLGFVQAWAGLDLCAKGLLW